MLFTEPWMFIIKKKNKKNQCIRACLLYVGVIPLFNVCLLTRSTHNYGHGNWRSPNNKYTNARCIDTLDLAMLKKTRSKKRWVRSSCRWVCTFHTLPFCISCLISFWEIHELLKVRMRNTRSFIEVFPTHFGPHTTIILLTVWRKVL